MNNKHPPYLDKNNFNPVGRHECRQITNIANEKSNYWREQMLEVDLNPLEDFSIFLRRKKTKWTTNFEKFH